jgi:hypothetical protein
VYTVLGRSCYFFLGGRGREGKGKIHIHGVICDDNDDDNVWRTEAPSKTNLIEVRRALRKRRCVQERDHDDICQWNGTNLYQSMVTQ